MSELKAIETMNGLWGNPKGRMDEPEWPSVERNIKFLEEEMDELKEAFEEKDIQGVLDAFADIVVFSTGATHQQGASMEELLAIVNRSNMSKFITSAELDDARSYADKKGFKVTFRESINESGQSYWAMVSAIDQIDTDTGKVWPAGKVMKPPHFVDAGSELAAYIKEASA